MKTLMFNGTSRTDHVRLVTKLVMVYSLVNIFNPKRFISNLNDHVDPSTIHQFNEFVLTQHREKY